MVEYNITRVMRSLLYKSLHISVVHIFTLNVCVCV